MPRNFPEVDDNKDVVTIKAPRKIIGGVLKRRNKRYNRSFSFPLPFHHVLSFLLSSLSSSIPAFVSRAISSLDFSYFIFLQPHVSSSLPCFAFSFSPKIIPLVVGHPTSLRFPLIHLLNVIFF